MRKLGELTWREAEAYKTQQPIVLLPVGSTEAHGPHLPLATDAILSDELAARAAAALDADGYATLIAPTLAYAITHYASEFAGTISIARETATALVADVCASLTRQGFARVCIVNSHLEPAHVQSLKDACARVPGVLFPDQLEKKWARTLTDEFKRGECHAGSYETSLVLAARPELVRDDVRRGLPEMSIDLARAMKEGKRTFIEAGAPEAYFGSPAAATVEEGNDIYARLVRMIVDEARATWPRSPSASAP